MNEEKLKRSKAPWIVLLLLLLVSLVQWGLHSFSSSPQSSSNSGVSPAGTTSINSKKQFSPDVANETLSQGTDSLTTTARQQLGLQKGHAQGVFLQNQAANLNATTDSLPLDSFVQNTIPVDTLKKDTPKRNLSQQPLHALLLPPAGRYLEPQTLHIQCAEPKCKGEIIWGDSLGTSAPTLPLNQSGKIYWRAADSLGNYTPWVRAEFEFLESGKCGINAYPVPLGGKVVCVDAYEYPNQPGHLPRDMISQSEATQVCSNLGKHLCSLDEWQAACRGRDNSRFAYGNTYNEKVCVSSGTKADRSGFREACRSWWGMYDMSGNLWEWTSTPNSQRQNFYEVAGGAWNTGAESACQSTKFSFYPQNQYSFVGFRCCK